MLQRYFDYGSTDLQVFILSFIKEAFLRHFYSGFSKCGVSHRAQSKLDSFRLTFKFQEYGV